MKESYSILLVFFVLFFTFYTKNQKKLLKGVKNWYNNSNAYFLFFNNFR